MKGVPGMSKLLDGIMEALLPPRCVFCRRTLRKGESGMCASCAASLPRRAAPREPGREAVEAFIAPLEFTGDVRDAVNRYKFEGATASAGVFAGILASCIEGCCAGEYDIISWVPVSKERLKERGFDQSQLIAMAAALDLGTVAVDTLQRVKNGKPQFGMGAAERYVNVQGAFAAADGELIAGKRVLLIDDIYTTGYTFMSCAAALRAAGARSVLCAAFAGPARRGRAE